ncbi:MAG: DUF262 domain-containing protein [Bacteroidia bacterium]|nr:DUF262 domain-containing protein [Bacteroidia bacterium]
MAELHVSKKTIGKLFSEMQGKRFVIPDFQRPYKWNVEKCETLWNDITNFTATEAKAGSDYFLGTIVSSVNEERNLDIIDGQQRITSFFLMLRSFYRKLEDMAEDDDVIGLKNQLAPCIWDINPISQKVSDRTKIHIESLVATAEDNDVFHAILESGNADPNAWDNYSVNYRFFKHQCDEFATQHPMQWKELCVTILQKCIILPIECESQETALTIFSTLNDRGMPLADSDIFKAQIYKGYATPELRREFTEVWKDLTNICKKAGMTIDDVFRYYTHVLRARESDKSKEIGLRRFYTGVKNVRLREAGLMDELMSLAKFWSCIYRNLEPEEGQYTISVVARQYLHCLDAYPNEYWKYVTSVFFFKNQTSPTFETDFTGFLKKLVAFLFVRFIEEPSVNAIKDTIFAACVVVHEAGDLIFKVDFNRDHLSQRLDNGYSSSRITRALLLLHAYQHPNQLDLIPQEADIEHIFPKKWQDTNYNGWSKQDADLFLDRFGNKIIFEKKLNIQAGNGYFGVKKSRYSLSKIASILDLSRYHKNDWVKEDIEAREAGLKSVILDFFASQLVLE